MKPPCLVISGTGTDVGKTVVTAALAAAWPASAGPLAVAKPVQTGATGRGWPPDLAFCCEHARWTPPHDEPALYSPCRFRLAASPHLAARVEGRTILVSRLADSMRRLQKTHAGVLLEGAGGLLTPLSQKATLVDLFVRLGWPVLLVAPAGLGALNQVLLSVEALRARQIALAGVVLVRSTHGRAGVIERDNQAYLAAKFAPVPVCGFPFLGQAGSRGFKERLRRAGSALWRDLNLR